MKLQKGLQIEFESGNKYKILKVYDGNICDIKALQPQFEWMPDFYPVYYSIKLVNYKILNEASFESQSVRNNEQEKEVCVICGKPRTLVDGNLCKQCQSDTSESKAS